MASYPKSILAKWRPDQMRTQPNGILALGSYQELSANEPSWHTHNEKWHWRLITIIPIPNNLNPMSMLPKPWSHERDEEDNEKKKPDLMVDLTICVQVNGISSNQHPSQTAILPNATLTKWRPDQMTTKIKWRPDQMATWPNRIT